MGKRDNDHHGRDKNCQFASKSPRAIGRGDFVGAVRTGLYFKTINVNG